MSYLVKLSLGFVIRLADDFYKFFYSSADFLLVSGLEPPVEREYRGHPDEGEDLWPLSEAEGVCEHQQEAVLYCRERLPLLLKGRDLHFYKRVLVLLNVLAEQLHLLHIQLPLVPCLLEALLDLYSIFKAFQIRN